MRPVAGAVSMSVEFRSECDDIEEAKSPSNTSVAAVAVKNADASVYKIIHGYLKQKNNSIIGVAAKVARKAASNKYVADLTRTPRSQII
jgi:GDP-mannose transporter